MNTDTRVDRGQMQAVIALILIVAGLAVFAALLFVRVPAENAHQFDLVLGNLEGAFVTAVAFYLGSSRGSAAKDATITALSQAPADPAPPSPPDAPPGA